jgi:CO/xanthine dehydrogenase Mo-binding subunit
MMFYPEEVLVTWAARQLGRPVKWTEDRRENFTATTQERGQVHDAEIALAKNGRILGVKDVFLHDGGAYDPYGLTVPINSQCTLLGPYDIPSYFSEFTAVFTNKPIVTPVRGAGRQHGVFVIERLLDIAARDLGLDRVEIRHRNFLGPDDFPHNHEIIFQDFQPLVYDLELRAGVAAGYELIGYDDFVREEHATVPKAIGTGHLFPEGTESARRERGYGEPGGRGSATGGTGQGHHHAGSLLKR